jgi:hypothetical protein
MLLDTPSDFQALLKHKLLPHHLKNLRLTCRSMRDVVSAEFFVEKSREAEALYKHIRVIAPNKFSVFSKLGKYKMDLCVIPDFGTSGYVLDVPFYSMRFEGKLYTGKSTNLWTTTDGAKPRSISVSLLFANNSIIREIGPVWISKVDKAICPFTAKIRWIDVELTIPVGGGGSSNMYHTCMHFMPQEWYYQQNERFWVNVP